MFNSTLKTTKIMTIVRERERERIREEINMKWLKGSGHSSRQTHKFKIVYHGSDRGHGNKLRPKGGKGRILVPGWTGHHKDMLEKTADISLG